MRLFRRKKKEEPKKEKYPKTRGRCPICGSACDVVDYGAFLGYFCMKCGPTQEIKVG
jgi:transcription elongation factor Elf1